MIQYERFGETAVLVPPEAAFDDGRRVATRYNRRFYVRGKRAFDVIVSFFALLVLFPLFVAISLLIALTEGRPVIFRQKRLGQDGRVFSIFKFRTMVKNAEEVLRSHPELMEEYRRTYKINNDPRISKLGKFLRKTTLDELPQLINVIVGEMSLVGPRPIVPDEIEKYGDWAFVYLAMKPGCAGLWQCSGRSQIDYADRVKLDIEYFEHASLRYDTWILARTFFDVIRCRGAN